MIREVRAPSLTHTSSSPSTRPDSRSYKGHALLVFYADDVAVAATAPIFTQPQFKDLLNEAIFLASMPLDPDTKKSEDVSTKFAAWVTVPGRKTRRVDALVDELPFDTPARPASTPPSTPHSIEYVSASYNALHNGTKKHCSAFKKLPWTTTAAISPVVDGQPERTDPGEARAPFECCLLHAKDLSTFPACLRPLDADFDSVPSSSSTPPPPLPPPSLAERLERAESTNAALRLQIAQLGGICLDAGMPVPMPPSPSSFSTPPTSPSPPPCPSLSPDASDTSYTSSLVDDLDLFDVASIADTDTTAFLEDEFSDGEVAGVTALGSSYSKRLDLTPVGGSGGVGVTAPRPRITPSQCGGARITSRKKATTTPPAPALPRSRALLGQDLTKVPHRELREMAREERERGRAFRAEKELTRSITKFNRLESEAELCHRFEEYLNEQAAANAFDQNNKNHDLRTFGAREVDLHGLYKSEAPRYLLHHIRKCIEEGLSRTYVICGQGKHSRPGIVSLKETIVQFVDGCSYLTKRDVEGNLGRFEVSWKKDLRVSELI